MQPGEVIELHLNHTGLLMSICISEFDMTNYRSIGYNFSSLLCPRCGSDYTYCAEMPVDSFFYHCGQCGLVWQGSWPGCPLCHRPDMRTDGSTVVCQHCGTVWSSKEELMQDINKEGGIV